MSTHGNDKQTESSSRSLKAALSKARLVQAERNDAVADLRAAEKARLDMLADEVAPIFKELPDGYDFEGVVSAGTRPRLWIDMLSFVAMAEDKRTYRFMKDARLGRDLIFESEDIFIATYSGKVVKWDSAINSGVQLADTDAMHSFDDPAPVYPDEYGQYPVPVPGSKTKYV